MSFDCINCELQKSESRETDIRLYKRVELANPSEEKGIIIYKGYMIYCPSCGTGHYIDEENNPSLRDKIAELSK